MRKGLKQYQRNELVEHNLKWLYVPYTHYRQYAPFRDTTNRHIYYLTYVYRNTTNKHILTI